VRSDLTAGGATDYAYEGERLARLSDRRGHSADFLYGADGQVDRVRASDGGFVAYHRRRGRLTAVIDSKGHSLSYAATPTGRLAAVQFDAAGDPQAAPARHPELEVIPFHQPLSPPGNRRFVHVRNAVVKGKPDYAIVRRGEAVASDGKVDAHVQAVLDGEDPDGMHAEALRALFLPAEPAGREEPVVLVAPVGLRDALAEALQRVAPDTTVFTASDPQRAEKNLAAQAAARGPARIVVSDAGLSNRIRDELHRLASSAEGLRGAPSVVVVGHNCGDLVREIDRLGQARELEGKLVALLTCGTRETPGMVERLLGEYGATCVVYFGELLDARRLPELLQEVQNRLSIPGEQARRLLKALLELRDRKATTGEPAPQPPVPPAKAQIGMKLRNARPTAWGRAWRASLPHSHTAA
jgi:hypothetical protein